MVHGLSVVVIVRCVLVGGGVKVLVAHLFHFLAFMGVSSMCVCSNCNRCTTSFLYTDFLGLFNT